MANLNKADPATALGPGEQLERARERSRNVVLAVLMLGGGAFAALIALTKAGRGGIFAGALPLWAALAAAALWLLCMVGGSLWYKRHADEIDLGEQMWAMATAAAWVVILYPVWHLLWRSGLVPAPDADLLYVALCAFMAVGWLWRRSR